MLKTDSELRCRDRFVGDALSAFAARPSGSISLAPRRSSRRPRVLLVEFRDEVYAALRVVLIEEGCEVVRAELGAAVTSALVRFSPDLVLINESMPDESGWLIACKLQFGRRRQPVWLYAARTSPSLAAWAETCQVARVIDYGGVLMRLLGHVRHDLAQWRRAFDADLV